MAEEGAELTPAAFDIKGGIMVPGWFLTLAGILFACYMAFIAPVNDGAKAIAAANSASLVRIETKLESVDQLRTDFNMNSAKMSASIDKISDGLNSIDRRVYALELKKENEELHGKNSENEAKLRKQSLQLDANRNQLIQIKSQIAQCRVRPPQHQTATKDDTPAIFTAAFYRELFGGQDKTKAVLKQPIKKVVGTRLAKN